jgi:hypothetical protein
VRVGALVSPDVGIRSELLSQLCKQERLPVGELDCLLSGRAC